MGARTAFLAFAVALVSAVAPPAHAATVALVKVGEEPAYPGGSRQEDPPRPPLDRLELRITADPGDADDLRVDNLRVTGTSPLRAGERCRLTAPGAVECDPGSTFTRTAAVVGTVVDLGDGDDRLTTVRGGRVAGGAGADLLDAPKGSSGLWDGGPGPDRIVGGAAWTVDYSARIAPVAVSLDGVANDGEAGEGDDAGDATSVVAGGAGPDVLRGGTRPVELHGGDGDDVLELSGTETVYRYNSLYTHGWLHGDAGNDRLNGGPAADLLEGGEGDDELLGAAGDDVLHGGAGADRTEGGDGDDELGLDTVGDGAPDFGAGGSGRDLASWVHFEHRDARIVAVLGDDHGPDGLSTERDALAADVEDVRVERVSSFDLTGSDGANRFELSGHGTVDARGGDDHISALSPQAGETRIAGGAGADVIIPSTGSRVDARDGEADSVRCGGASVRDLLLDVGRDRADPCVGGLSLRSRYDRKVRRGGRLRFRVDCHDPYHACRVLMRPRIAGRRLAPLALRIPAGSYRRTSVRIPARTPRGRWLVWLSVRSASPFAGAAAWADPNFGAYVRVIGRPR